MSITRFTEQDGFEIRAYSVWRREDGFTVRITVPWRNRGMKTYDADIEQDHQRCCDAMHEAMESLDASEAEEKEGA